MANVRGELARHGCAAHVFEGGGSYPYPCSRPGKIEREGKWYCGIHDPERRAARRREWEEKWERESAERCERDAKAKQRAQDIEAIVRWAAEDGGCVCPYGEHSRSYSGDCNTVIARRIVAEWDAKKEPSQLVTGDGT